MDEKDKSAIEGEILAFMQQKDLSAQQKYNEIQKLAKKYNMPLEKLMKNIIMDWMKEDYDKKKQKSQNKKIL